MSVLLPDFLTLKSCMKSVACGSEMRLLYLLKEIILINYPQQVCC